MIGVCTGPSGQLSQRPLNEDTRLPRSLHIPATPICLQGPASNEPFQHTLAAAPTVFQGPSLLSNAWITGLRDGNALY